MYPTPPSDRASQSPVGKDKIELMRRRRDPNTAQSILVGGLDRHPRTQVRVEPPHSAGPREKAQPFHGSPPAESTIVAGTDRAFNEGYARRVRERRRPVRRADRARPRGDPALGCSAASAGSRCQWLTSWWRGRDWGESAEVNPNPHHPRFSQSPAISRLKVVFTLAIPAKSVQGRSG